MTMLDDDVLSTLFAQTAETMAVPESGRADILERAYGSAVRAEATDEDVEDGDDGALEAPAALTAARTRRLARVVKTHRLLSVAACVVLALAIAGGASWIGATSAKPPVESAGLGANGHSASRSTSPLKSTGTPPGFSSSSAGGTGNTFSGATGTAAGTTATGGSAPTAASPAQAGLSQTTAPPSTNSDGNLPDNVGQSARVEQTGTLTLTVGKGQLAKTITELTFLADTLNGFVANSQSESGAVAVAGEASGSITLQVPVADFATAVKKAQSLGKTDDLTTKATDVTGQYTDLQQRIAALQTSQQQYLTIMARATSIGDVLSVQAQLDTIQSEIEQLQGQLQVLSSETDYSTLTVLVSEGAPKVHHPAPVHRSGLSIAWHDSMHGFADGVDGLVRLAGPALFVLLCGAVVFFGGRVLWRRYQRHNL